MSFTAEYLKLIIYLNAPVNTLCYEAYFSVTYTFVVIGH